MADDRYRLYRCYDLDGILLYVGLTLQQPAARQRQHFNSSLWWPKVSRFDVAELPAELTYEQASLVEVRAIRDEHPLYNWTHQATDNPRRVRLVSSPNTHARDATLDCLRVCGAEWRRLFAAALGPQLSPRPTTGKRPRGRPKKLASPSDPARPTENDRPLQGRAAKLVQQAKAKRAGAPMGQEGLAPSSPRKGRRGP
jgi:hypothetical protein